MALCINREFSLQLQGITLCNYQYVYSAANRSAFVAMTTVHFDRKITFMLIDGTVTNAHSKAA